MGGKHLFDGMKWRQMTRTGWEDIQYYYMKLISSILSLSLHIQAARYLTSYLTQSPSDGVLSHNRRAQFRHSLPNTKVPKAENAPQTPIYVVEEDDAK
jgi:hypothetical protein